MLQIRSRDELSLALPPDRTRAVVMTMGSLHEGHAQLIDAARREVGPAGHVLVTIFVNPTQFGPQEDLDAYPRDEAADLDVCLRRGADAVYLPAVSDLYGSVADPSEAITVDPGPLGLRWEGEARPTHFRGVLTVVSKLLHTCRPDVAVFGEKDYQQLTLVRRMVDQLDFGVRIVGEPTARDGDGLALSSRNVYLDAGQRSLAAYLPRALGAGAEAARAGADADVVGETVERVLREGDGLSVDYGVVTDPEMGADPGHGPARILAAVRVGSTRLLDNIDIELLDVA